MSGEQQSTREKAAAARQAAEKAEKARLRRIQVIGGAVIAVLVVGIVAIGVLGSRAGGGTDPGLALPSPTAGAPLPSGVLGADAAQPYGWPVNPQSPSSTPLVVVWEDFQCPICAVFESGQGKDLVAAAEAGDIQLVYRPATFLDSTFPRSNLSSARATNAWGAAIEAGVGLRYHELVFANQPEREGDGFTDELLLDLGKQAGLSGAAYDTFAQQVADRSWFGWVASSSQQFYDDNLPGTPYVSVNGTEVPGQYLQAGLLDYIASQS
jgi:protein-disulfide isomerase